MAINFTSTAQANVNGGVKVLIYGRAGAGKTTLAATCPAPLIISAESGLLSLRHVDIPVIEVGSVSDLQDSYQWVTESQDAAAFQTVYIDSLSEIAEKFLSEAKATSKDPRQAYGELIDRMMITVRSFRDLKGKHVVMTAKQESFKDEVTQISMFGPSMPGAKLGNQLPYLFDEVFRLGIGKDPENGEYRFLQTKADIQYEAKDRSGALAALEYPDLGVIFHKILNKGVSL